MRRAVITLVGALVLALALPHPAQARGRKSKASAQMESWYLNLGIGYSSVTYPSAIQLLIDVLKALPGVKNTPVYLDLGVYFPVNLQTILGASVNGTGDRYDANGNWMQINQYLYSVSAMRFFGPVVGKGFFLRGDVGFAKLNVQDSSGSNESSETGWGLLAGGGYSFNIFSGTRLMLGANYGYKKVEGDSYKSVNLGVSLLF